MELCTGAELVIYSCRCSVSIAEVAVFIVVVVISLEQSEGTVSPENRACDFRQSLHLIKTSLVNYSIGSVYEQIGFP